MFARFDNFFSETETFPVRTFRRNGDYTRVVEDFGGAIDPLDLPPGPITCAFKLLPAVRVGFVHANDLDFRVVEHHLEHTLRMTVFCSVLGHSQIF